jgi:hypothetical protein
MSLHLSVKHMTCRGEIKVRYVTRLSSLSSITKVVIRIRKSKKDRQHNGQRKNDKQRATEHTYKTKDRVL